MPYEVVRKFEERIASYAGARYGVAVESCSAALFLSCLYKKVGYTTIPKRTYPSVPCAIINAGGQVGFRDENWSGTYKLEPAGIVDGALRFRRDMYEGGLHCLSFHTKKHLPIGRGGMILTDDADAQWWLRKARFDGRSETRLSLDRLEMTGHNMYMTPEQASRGLQLFELWRYKECDEYDLDNDEQGYPDLSQYHAYGAPHLQLRPAEPRDANRLLTWKNEEDTRRNSIVSQALIDPADHMSWLQRTLIDPSVELSIIELHGEAIGDLRLNFDGETEVSIRMAKEFRGKGLATKAVGMVTRPGTLKAKIVATNLASMRVFIANGYRPYEFIQGPVNYYVFRKSQ